MIFTDTVSFLKTIFDGNSRFYNTKFNCNTQFSLAKFNDVSNFNNCIFKEDADFSQCDFKHAVSFEDAQFRKQVNFQNIKFQNQVSFSKTKFKKSVNFDRSVFLGNTVFQHVVIEDEINCNYVNFNGSTYFTNTEFIGIANFYCATFHKNADFHDSVFSEIPSFNRTEFMGFANFENIKFNGDIDSRLLNSRTQNVAYVKFNRGANFSRSVFENFANFLDAQFLGSSYFHDTKFNGVTHFYHCTFTGEIIDFITSDMNSYQTDFSRSYFDAKVRFPNNGFQNFTKFRDVEFENPNRISFNGNMSKVSFLHTDITRVKFGGKTRWNNEYKIHEETQIGQKQDENKKVELNDILAIYRQLRDNYEYNLRYEEAGKFFVRESEITRMYEDKQVQNNSESTIVKRSLLKQWFGLKAWYKLFAYYGESFYRPIIFMAGLFGFGILYFTLWDNHNYLNPLLRTINAALPYFGMSENAIWLDYFLKITVLPFLGMLYISLRRKYERKHRY